jgi:hypothetical protein
MAKRRIGIIAFILCVCLYLIPFRAQAASTVDAKEPISADTNCSLSISYCSGSIAFSELPVKLYKIADVSADYQYTLTSSFEKSNLNLNGMRTVGEWNVIRTTLETFILANEVAADFNAVTDFEGKASFDALKPGLYLSITECIMKDETTYVFDSTVIALPGLSADGLWQYQVDVTSKSEIIPPIENDEEIELKVLKLWKGDSGSSTRPTTIEIDIFRNGTSYQNVTLSEDNHWTYTWSAKDDGSDWKIIERNIPTGYTMTIEERETSFVLTNTLNQDVPDLPQTGDTSNIMLWIILMIVSGSMLNILGIIEKRKRYDEQKK